MFNNARTEPKVAVNHLGYKQYFGSNGTELCISCHKPYVNIGPGVLCDTCDVELPADEHSAAMAHD